MAGMLGISLVCVVVLGVPLAVLARHQVWTSAHDRLREQAASVATGLEDRLDAGQPVALDRYLTLTPNRRITVAFPHGRSTSAGPRIPGPVMQAAVAVADARVTVEAATGPTTARAREATLVVAGLAVFAVVVAAAVAVWQARRLAAPVAGLLARADALGQGQFAAEPLASGLHEIDELSAVLERSARQIGTSMELQRTFASDAAHQLRTPLTSIGLHLDEMGQIGGADVQSEAEEAQAQVQRLDRVITSLLARAKGDSAQPERFDLARLVDEGCAAWERILAAQGRPLIRQLRPGVPVLARRDHLLAILGSLLDNAIGHGDGAVTVVVEAKAAAILRVRDSGRGVPAALRNSVFERRVSGDRGTGIGLALARSLAESEDGRLEVSGTNPAELLLTLPIADQPR
jgi:signal transduction histidine kinase